MSQLTPIYQWSGGLPLLSKLSGEHAICRGQAEKEQVRQIKKRGKAACLCKSHTVHCRYYTLSHNHTMNVLSSGLDPVLFSRCANCFDCPCCMHTLSTRATNIPAPLPDDPTKTAMKKAYYLACGFCRWTSRDVGMADKSVGGCWHHFLLTL